MSTRHDVMLPPLRGGGGSGRDVDRYAAALLSPTVQLVEGTRKQHALQLRRLSTVLGRDVEWMLGEWRTATAELLTVRRVDGRSMTEAESSGLLRTLANSVIAVLRHVPGEAARWPGALEGWRAVGRISTAPAEDARTAPPATGGTLEDAAATAVARARGELGVECPSCGRWLSARRLSEEGLVCGAAGCAATLKALAAACTSVCGYVMYAFVPTTRRSRSMREAWWNVRYAGITVNLEQRLGEHMRRRLSRVHVARATAESTLAAAGERLHVWLHACESTLVELLRPTENKSRACDQQSYRYRVLERGADGTAGRVMEYDMRGCAYRHADALLDLAAWAPRTQARRGLEDVAMASAGVLAMRERWPEAGFGRNQRTQAEVATEVMGHAASEWRVGRCRHQAFYGYCRCAVPCALRWPLEGKPEERDYSPDLRETREVETDTAAMRALVSAIRASAGGGVGVGGDRRLLRDKGLTQELMMLRARQLYGREDVEVRSLDAAASVRVSAGGGGA